MAGWAKNVHIIQTGWDGFLDPQLLSDDVKVA
jgi:hypothetical protein